MMEGVGGGVVFYYFFNLVDDSQDGARSFVFLFVKVHLVAFAGVGGLESDFEEAVVHLGVVE